MTGFLLRRLLYLVCLVVVSTSVAYLLAATQLNPRARYEGRNPPPPAAVVDATLDSLNMNDKVPVLTRFGRWGSGLLRGDLGRTIDNQAVNAEIGRRMWVSLRLVLIASVVGTVLGVAAGAFGAVKQYRLSDRDAHGVLVRHPLDSGRRAGRALQERRHRPEQPARLQAAVHDRRIHAWR
jgi:peptide/nickel transport system permease protein